jgi:acyl-CoA thioesterase
MSRFDSDTAVHRRGESTVYDAELDAGWSIGDKPNGGYLLAILARAAIELTGKPHPLAVSAHYLRAPSVGPAEVRAELVRSGRRVSASRATLWQGDKPYIDALVTSGELHEAPVEWDDKTEPDMPDPQECPIATNPHLHISLFEQVELRVDPATAPFPAPNGDPTMRFWFRLADGAAPGLLSLLLAVDSGPPTVFHLGSYGWAPTVELTVLLRGLPAAGWLKVESRTSTVSDGWFDETATVWDSTGRMVAQSRQLALVAGG